MTLDKTDLKILEHIQQDSTITNKDLALKVNLTATPIHERIKRMEHDGYIKKYVALLDAKKLEKSLTAFCNVSLKEHAQPVIKKFEQDILLLPMVTECYNTTGNFDYLLKVIVKNMAEYQDFIINKLASLSNIGNTYTALVIDDIKVSTEIPLLY